MVARFVFMSSTRGIKRNVSEISDSWGTDWPASPAKVAKAPDVKEEESDGEGDKSHSSAQPREWMDWDDGSTGSQAWAEAAKRWRESSQQDWQEWDAWSAPSSEIQRNADADVDALAEVLNNAAHDEAGIEQSPEEKLASAKTLMDSKSQTRCMQLEEALELEALGKLPHEHKTLQPCRRKHRKEYDDTPKERRRAFQIDLLKTELDELVTEHTLEESMSHAIWEDGEYLSFDRIVHL